jgi:hypothetical protein
VVENEIVDRRIYAAGLRFLDGRLSHHMEAYAGSTLWLYRSAASSKWRMPMTHDLCHRIDEFDHDMASPASQCAWCGTTEPCDAAECGYQKRRDSTLSLQADGGGK